MGYLPTASGVSRAVRNGCRFTEGVVPERVSASPHGVMALFRSGGDMLRGEEILTRKRYKWYRYRDRQHTLVIHGRL